MNPFDQGIISFLNSFADRSQAFDAFVSVVLVNNFVKTGLIMVLLWWVWFQQDDSEDKRREFLLFGVVTSILATVVARILASILPFRERPLHNPALHFIPPFGINEKALPDWSSFPSDHAVLFFALATCIFFASRRLGILALLHVFFIVCLTRVYLGFHYPTDILAGALLGIAFASLSKIPALRNAIAKPGIRWMRWHPPSFYAALFLVTS